MTENEIAALSLASHQPIGVERVNLNNHPEGGAYDVYLFRGIRNGRLRIAKPGRTPWSVPLELVAEVTPLSYN